MSTTVLTDREAKDMIRSVVTTKGIDAFWDDDDIRYEIQQIIEVPDEAVTDADFEQIRQLVGRARVTVTFGRSR